MDDASTCSLGDDAFWLVGPGDRNTGYDASVSPLPRYDTPRSARQPVSTRTLVEGSPSAPRISVSEVGEDGFLPQLLPEQDETMLSVPEPTLNDDAFDDVVCDEDILRRPEPLEPPPRHSRLQALKGIGAVKAAIPVSRVTKPAVPKAATTATTRTSPSPRREKSQEKGKPSAAASRKGEGAHPSAAAVPPAVRHGAKASQRRAAQQPPAVSQPPANLESSCESPMSLGHRDSTVESEGWSYVPKLFTAAPRGRKQGAPLSPTATAPDSSPRAALPASGSFSLQETSKEFSLQWGSLKSLPRPSVPASPTVRRSAEAVESRQQQHRLSCSMESGWGSGAEMQPSSAERSNYYSSDEDEDTEEVSSVLSLPAGYSPVLLTRRKAEEPPASNAPKERRDGGAGGGGGSTAAAAAQPASHHHLAPRRPVKRGRAGNSSVGSESELREMALASGGAPPPRPAAACPASGMGGRRGSGGTPRQAATPTAPPQRGARRNPSPTPSPPQQLQQQQAVAGHAGARRPSSQPTRSAGRREKEAHLSTKEKEKEKDHPRRAGGRERSPRGVAENAAKGGAPGSPRSPKGAPAVAPAELTLKPAAACEPEGVTGVVAQPSTPCVAPAGAAEGGRAEGTPVAVPGTPPVVPNPEPEVPDSAIDTTYFRVEEASFPLVTPPRAAAAEATPSRLGVRCNEGASDVGDEFFTPGTPCMLVRASPPVEPAVAPPHSITYYRLEEGDFASARQGATSGRLVPAEVTAVSISRCTEEDLLCIAGAGEDGEGAPSPSPSLCPSTPHPPAADADVSEDEDEVEAVESLPPPFPEGSAVAGEGGYVPESADVCTASERKTSNGITHSVSSEGDGTASTSSAENAREGARAGVCWRAEEEEEAGRTCSSESISELAASHPGGAGAACGSDSDVAVVASGGGKPPRVVVVSEPELEPRQAEGSGVSPSPSPRFVSPRGGSAGTMSRHSSGSSLNATQMQRNMSISRQKQPAQAAGGCGCGGGCTIM